MRSENDPSCVVVYSLQLLDAVARSVVEHSIAVVDPGQDQTTGQCLCQFRSQRVSNVSDGLMDGLFTDRRDVCSVDIA